ncbi:hypothetical protein ElyMa_004676300 [Elysia marginata]|uniref:EGF-like domain-containing protein n=1 Tax=Elysia marginata TaxID=1093978 RepID=A0AAV4I6W9_9GAST|nr:hypothetical protein ElyMa_004676300 [Elysia marginata]
MLEHDILQLVSQTNRYRSRVASSHCGNYISNMNKLEWSEELSSQAEQLVSCRSHRNRQLEDLETLLDHVNVGRKRDRPGALSDILRWWYNQKRYYDADEGACFPWSSCKQYMNSLDLWGRRGDLRAEESVFCRHASLSEADQTSSYIAIPVHFLDVITPSLPLSSSSALAFNYALEHCLGKAVVSGDMSKASQFPPFYCRQHELQFDFQHGDTCTGCSGDVSFCENHLCGTLMAIVAFVINIIIIVIIIIIIIIIIFINIIIIMIIIIIIITITIIIFIIIVVVVVVIDIEILQLSDPLQYYTLVLWFSFMTRKRYLDLSAVSLKKLLLFYCTDNVICMQFFTSLSSVSCNASRDECECTKTCSRAYIGVGQLDASTCTCTCQYGGGPNCDQPCVNPTNLYGIDVCEGLTQEECQSPDIAEFCPQQCSCRPMPAGFQEPL